MKVIDLLNKIANEEEVPKKIQVYSDIFVLDYGNKVYETEKTRTNLLSIYNGNILNYEAVIIEEDKKIETIDPIDYCHSTDTSKDMVLVEKINEIIDKINNKEVK